jgi:hypothetical protein
LFEQKGCSALSLMFVWFKLVGIEDSSKLITEKARNQKVLLVPGESFLTTSRTRLVILFG